MDTQKQLLKWLITNPDWLAVTHDEIFKLEPSLLKIQLISKRILQSGKPISFASLKYTLRNKPELLSQVEYLENETQIDKATALLIREDLRQIALAREIKAAANIDLTDTKAYKQYIETLNRLSQENEPQGRITISSFNEYNKHIEPPSTVLDSGLTFLSGTGSDFRTGGLYNFLAPSGEFKTGTLTHITKHQLAKGRNVLFFEMEGTDQENFHRIGHGLLKMTPYEYSQLTSDQIRDRFSGMGLGHLDTAYGSVIYIEDLKEIVEELQEKNGYKYDYIIIDYSAQVKLKSSKKTNQQYQDDEEVFRQLKLLSIQLEVVLISAVQANRAGYNRKKSLGRENAAASMGGIHASDGVIAIRYMSNKEKPFRETEADEIPDDVKGFVKMEIIKKRKGTIQVGDKFMHKHLASGNIRFLQVDFTDQTEAEKWDNIFSDDIEVE